MKVKTNMPEVPKLIGGLDEFCVGEKVDIETTFGTHVKGILAEIFHDRVFIREESILNDSREVFVMLVGDMKAVRPACSEMPIGQVQTERGIVNIGETFRSIEEAKANDYVYAFHSKILGMDLYSKALDDRGFRHSFATVKE